MGGKTAALEMPAPRSFQVDNPGDLEMMGLCLQPRSRDRMRRTCQASAYGYSTLTAS